MQFRTISKRCLLGVAGATTLAMAPAAMAATEVYVPAGGANKVLVVDLDSQKVVRTIEGVQNTHGLALDSSGAMLLAGSLNAVATDKMPEKPAGMSESDHAAHHAAKPGAAAAAADLNGLVYQIDAAEGRVTRKIKVAGPVHHTLVTPDGRYGIATHPMGGGISVIDLDAGKLVQRVATGPVPNYALTSEDGATLWVSNTGNNTVSEIDTRNWFVRRNFLVDGGPEHMELTADGKTLYVIARAAGQVVAVDLARGDVVKRYPVGDSPHGIALSGDGEQLFVSATGDNKVTAIQLATGVMRTLPLAPQPYHITALPGDDGLLVSSRGASKLWVVSQSGLQVEGEVAIPGIGHQMVVGEGR